MAPALRLMGRRWYIASDDLPGPALLGVIYHFVYTIVMAIAVAYLEPPRDDCLALKRYWAYYVLLLILDAVLLIVLSVLLYASIQGSVLDIHLRKPVPLITYFTSAGYILLIGTNIFGTHLHFLYDGDTSCYDFKPGTIFEPRFFSLNAVFAHWSTIAVFLLIALVSYNHYQDHTDLHTWEQRCLCLGTLLCCRTPQPESKAPRRYLLTLLSSVRTRAPMVANSIGGVGTRSTGASADDGQRGLGSGGWRTSLAELKVRLLRRSTTTQRTADSSRAGSVTNATDVESGGPRQEQLQGHSQRQGGEPEQEPEQEGVRDEGTMEEVVEELEDASRWSPLLRLAAVFCYFYGHVDLTFSDVATGMMLVGIKQRIERGEDEEGIRSTDTDAHSRQPLLASPPNPAATATADVTLASPATDTTKPAPGTADHATLSPTGSDAMGLSGGEQQQSLAPELAAAEQQEPGLGPGGTSVVTDTELTDAQHYFRYACAIYGWPMYLWMHRARSPQRCCGMCGAGCVCCTTLRKHPSLKGLQRLVVTKTMTVEAIKRMTGLSPEHHLLYVSGANEVGGMLPHMIALDESRRQVIVSVRGSMSQHDVVTDLLAEPARLAPEWLAAVVGRSPVTLAKGSAGAGAGFGRGRGRGHAHQGQEGMSGGEGVHEGPASPPVVQEVEGEQVGKSSRWAGGGLAHRGMYCCALTIYKDMETRGVLHAVLNNDTQRQAALAHPMYARDLRGWGLVVVGHSLGAGVAALLALRLRAEFPHADVRCWSFAPPGGLLSQDVADGCAHFVTSVVTGRDLVPRLSMRNIAALNKEMLAASAACKVPKAVLWARTVLLRKKWARGEVFREESEIPQEVRDLIKQYTMGVAASKDAEHFQAADDFTAPGRVMFLDIVPQSSLHTLGDALSDAAHAAADAVSIAVHAAVNTVSTAEQGGGATSAAGPQDTTSRAPQAPSGLGADAEWLARKGSGRLAGPGRTFAPAWMSAAALRDKGLAISKRMFIMHLPDFQMDVLRAVLADRGLKVPFLPLPAVSMAGSTAAAAAAAGEGQLPLPVQGAP